MSSPGSTRNRVVLSIAGTWLIALVLHSCGGGGGGGSDGSSGPPNTRPGQNGTPAAEPTATPGTTIVAAGESVAGAIKRSSAGSTVIVSPGTYGPVELAAGEAADSITLLADVTGLLTDSPSAPVSISAGGRTAAISLSGQSNLTVDGFTIRGGLNAGILVVSSPGTTVRNCIVGRSSGDGIRFQQSNLGLVFNNLATDNGGAGIRVRGSNQVRVINNTVYKNAASGFSTDSSSAIEVENNIFDQNAPFGITVDPSVSGLTEDFNLNTDGYRGVAAGPADLVDQNPLFIFPDGGDFHVQALAGGTTSPVVDAGDPDTDPELVASLLQGVTQNDGTSDALPVDVGYHYPQPPGTPTPRPRATRTSTPRGTPRASAAIATATRTPGGPTATPTQTSVGRATRTPRPTRTPRG